MAVKGTISGVGLPVEVDKTINVGRAERASQEILYDHI
jgi:hypothetical protein